MALTDNTIQLIGAVGAVMFLVSYALASTERLHIRSLSYQIMNLLGAIAFIIVGIHFKTYGPLTVNFFWALIACWMIIKILRQSNKQQNMG